MLRDITLGQYYQTESVIHKLDPRVKLVGTICYIISLFLVNNIWGYVIAALFLAAMIKLSNVPFKFMVKGMRAILFLLLITVVFNMFLTPGEALVSFWKLTITREGLKLAIMMAIRLSFLIIGSSVMTLTTTPNNLTDGMENLMKPLRKIKVPVHEIAMMMSIALRFIPILLEETDKIMKAQIARGADFESGNIMKKAKALVPLLVPLFISAFRRANDLAMAMEARCYRGGDGRTKMKPLVYKKADRIGYAVLVLYLLVCLSVGKFAEILFGAILGIMMTVA
ncbi:MAG: energy-coupling factor transporter transmembrane protein EcfT [Lachnospiraceae bacterium]|nr:energy-coupling factor transporter transmembrane protein EcfT [Lachnospiraceae bacterium]MBR5317665.1 energy-coupling factor transporter transmembrane protein EcfT [Lachnospiraceae bacterium]